MTEEILSKNMNRLLGHKTTRGSLLPFGKKSMPGVRTTIDSLIRKDSKLTLPWTHTRKREMEARLGLAEANNCIKARLTHPTLSEHHGQASLSACSQTFPEQLQQVLE